MRRLNYGLCGLFALVLFISVSCTESKLVDDGARVGEKNSVQQAKDVWTCPMHPQVRQDGPGKCPICGMDLVKAESEAEIGTGSDSEFEHKHEAVGDNTKPAGHAGFHLSASRSQMIGVKTGVVENKPLFKSIEVAGRVAFDPELYTAQSEYVEAIKQSARVQESPIAEVKHSARRMVESAKLRLKVLGLSDGQIKALANRGEAGANLLISSPGENIWIYADVFEMDLPSVQPGLSAVISGGSLGVQELAGRVISVDRVIKPETRTAKVRIQAMSSAVNLRPEAYVNVKILSPLGKQMTVPFDAVFDTGREAWVFVAGPEGAFEPRKVTVKFRANDDVAIASGLNGDEKIVTSANFLIDSESRLRGVMETQTSDAAHGAKSKTPECPEGQFWHAEMKHCMVKPE